MKKQSTSHTVAVVISLLLILLGVVCAVAFFLPRYDDVNLGKVLIYVAIICVVTGAVILAVCVRKHRNTVDNVVEEPTSDVQYIPSDQAYRVINAERYQSIDEKFDQISQMDKTQFVTYIARLFSTKGYQVKLTPVIDNFGIDMLVEKSGSRIAVRCLLTNKVLSDTDVNGITEDAKNYDVNKVMALTNMYFDRSAQDYAKSQRITLADRNYVAQNLMK